MIAGHRRHRKRPLFGAVFVCALLISSAVAADPASLAETARGSASAVTGDRLRLAGSDTDVLLAGIIAPRGRDDPMDAPLATEARDALAQLLADHTVSVRSVPAGPDRAGRLRAHVLRDDGLWLQVEMLRQGFARVALSPDTALLSDELLAAERAAAIAHRGVWAQPAYALRNAADATRLSRDIGTFQVIEGDVVSTARRGDDIFLNFGKDYRHDVTAVIPRGAWPSFRSAKPMSLTGKHVQFRGWIVRHNGPEIELTVPALLIVSK